MRILTLSEYFNDYTSNLEKQDWVTADRSTLSAQFPFSVLIEGDFVECEKASEWCESNIHKLTTNLEQNKWGETFYGKESYDYGVWEFFFEEERKCLEFKKLIPAIYATTPDGRRYKTKGWEEEIYID